MPESCQNKLHPFITQKKEKKRKQLFHFSGDEALCVLATFHAAKLLYVTNNSVRYGTGLHG